MIFVKNAERLNLKSSMRRKRLKNACFAWGRLEEKWIGQKAPEGIEGIEEGGEEEGEEEEEEGGEGEEKEEEQEISKIFN